MGKARNYIPALKYGNKIYPEDMASPFTWGNYHYVDEDNGNDTSNSGSSLEKAFATLQYAMSYVEAGDVVFVKARAMATGATDPVSYTENAVIPAAADRLTIIGVNTGRTQGGLPQLKVGATTTSPIITVRAPGCRIMNIGFNGIGGTGGGILLDDDGSTKTAFGTTIENCHFKNCVGTTATDSRTGGAIQWAATGGAWQVLVANNRFYKNVGDITVMGTSGSVPQDVVIEGNVFSGPAASVDSNIYTGGSGVDGIIIKDNHFTAMPALSSGSVLRYVDLTGSVGLMANNYFASLTAATGSPVTFAADGTGGKVPTTVFMAGNWGETTTAGESGEIIRT